LLFPAAKAFIFNKGKRFSQVPSLIKEIDQVFSGGCYSLVLGVSIDDAK